MNIPLKLQGRVTVEDYDDYYHYGPNTGLRRRISLRDAVADENEDILHHLPKEIKPMLKANSKNLKKGKFLRKLDPTKASKKLAAKLLAREVDIGVNEDTDPVVYQTALNISSKGKDEKQSNKKSHQVVLGFQDTIRNHLVEIARRTVPVDHTGFAGIHSTTLESISDQFFYFDDIILMLREFWQVYEPGGESLEDDEIAEVEEDLIAWMIKIPGYEDGIQFKYFIQWLEPICSHLANIKGSTVIFDIPHHTNANALISSSSMVASGMVIPSTNTGMW
jgi:hypothetical protein